MKQAAFAAVAGVAGVVCLAGVAAAVCLAVVVAAVAVVAPAVVLMAANWKLGYLLTFLNVVLA